MYIYLANRSKISDKMARQTTKSLRTSNVSSSAELNGHLKFALSIAKDAGLKIRNDFYSDKHIVAKDDNTPCTDTDTKINEMVIRAVRRTYPKHDIFAEEGSYTENKGSHVWVCDPLDGTIAFVRGIQTSVFSLALVRDGEPVVGVVYNPFANNMFYAQQEGGAFMNGNRIKVSKESKLGDSVLGMAAWRDSQFNLKPIYEKLIERGSSVLMLGSLTYMGALVSTGNLTATLHAARSAYDSAATKIIVEEADGKVTDLFGGKQRYDGQIKGCVMSNGYIHDELVSMIRKL